MRLMRRKRPAIAASCNWLGVAVALVKKSVLSS